MTKRQYTRGDTIHESTPLAEGADQPIDFSAKWASLIDASLARSALLAGKVGKVNLNIRKIDSSKTYRFFPSVRFLLACFLFGMLTIESASYTTFNFTINCMVNSSFDTQTVHNDTSGHQACGTQENETSTPLQGELRWTSVQVSNLLAASSYGALVFSFPLGLLVFKFGAKRIAIPMICVYALTAALTPSAALYFGNMAHGEWATFVVRFCSGLSTWPASMFIISRWGPAQETGMLTALALSGLPLGAIIANNVAGGFCSISSHGWVYPYYVWGGVSILWCVVFGILFSDDPKDCRLVSKRELAYILEYRKVSGDAASDFSSVPWRSLFLSKAVIAVLTASFAIGWIFTLIAQFLPMYTNEVLRFSPTANAIVSSVPPVMQSIGRLPMITVSDRLERAIGKTKSVKVFVAIALGVPCLALFGITIIPASRCDLSMLAVVLFAIGHFGYSADFSVTVKGAFYIAPRYIGITSALGMTSICLAGLIVPYVQGFLVQNSEVAEWNQLFYVSIAVTAVCAAVYMVFGNGDVQPWAETTDEEEVEVTTNEANEVVFVATPTVSEALDRWRGLVPSAAFRGSIF